MKLIRSVSFLAGATTALLSCGAMSAVASEQDCAPPDEFKAKLHGKPNVDALNELGVWFASHEKYACAADAFGSSLQTDPAQPALPHVVFEFGASLYLSGNTREAVPSLQEAERLGYRDEKLHMILAAALDSTQAVTEAEVEWRKALDFDPENNAALEALSSDLLSQGDYQATIELLDTPRLAAQRSAQQAINLGTAYAKAGKLDEARRVLADGLNTNPDSHEVALQLAGVLTQLDRKDEAAMVMQLAESRKRQNASQAGK